MGSLGANPRPEGYGVMTVMTRTSGQALRYTGEKYLDNIRYKPDHGHECGTALTDGEQMISSGRRTLLPCDVTLCYGILHGT